MENGSYLDFEYAIVKHDSLTFFFFFFWALASNQLSSSGECMWKLCGTMQKREEERNTHHTFIGMFLQWVNDKNKRANFPLKTLWLTGRLILFVGQPTNLRIILVCIALALSLSLSLSCSGHGYAFFSDEFKNNLIFFVYVLFWDGMSDSRGPQNATSFFAAI